MPDPKDIFVVVLLTLAACRETRQTPPLEHRPLTIAPHDLDIEELRAALDAAPDDPQRQLDLGWALVQERIRKKDLGEPLPPSNDRARELLRAARLADPTNVQILFGLCRDFEVQGELEQARSCMEKATQLEPQYYVARVALGRILIHAGHYTEAERVLRAVIEELEGSAADAPRQNRMDATAYLATALAWQGKDSKAEELLQNAANQALAQSWRKEGKNFACTHMALGELFRSQGRDREAAWVLVEGADLEPTDPVAQYHAARQLYFNGRAQEARVYLDRALALEDVRSFRRLARRITLHLEHTADSSGAIPVDALLNRTGHALEAMDFVAAHELVDKALAQGGGARVHVIHGFMLILSHDYPGADEAFERAREGQQDQEGSAVGQAHLALAQGDNARARALLVPRLETLRRRVTGITQQPEGYHWMVYAMAQLGTAWAYANDTQHELALLHFDEVLGLHSASILALVGKGNSLNALGRLDEAEAVLRQVLKLDRDNPYAHAELGAVLLARGDDDKAADAFEAALEVEPIGYTCPHEGLGLVMLRQGRTAEAKAAFEKAIAINPDIEYRKYNELARIHIADGELDEARRLLDKSVENFPHDPEAAEMLAELGTP